MGDELFASGTGVRNFSVTIPSGSNTSNVIDLDRYRFVGIQFPAAMTGTVLTFLVGAGPGIGDTLSHAVAALAGGNFRQLYGDDGVIVQVTITVDNCVGLGSQLAAKLAPFRFIALRSNQTEAADRALTVSLR